jgi:hypothetical protein
MSEQKIAFGLFIAGALLFAAASASPFPSEFEAVDKALLCMPLFGLPYVAREFTRRINWLVILYLALLVPAFYFAAWIAALYAWGAMLGGSLIPPSGAMLVAGLAGGFAGSALSILALFLPGLRADGASGALMIAGIALLTALGGFGLAMPEGWSPVLWLYLPWQIVFGYFLSRLLRPSPARSLRDAEVAAIGGP